MKRKLIIYGAFFSLILIGIFITYKVLWEHKPTCFDGIKNQNEEGIDCSGNCEQVCRVKATEINIVWAKSFEVAAGVWNIASLIENPNFDFNMSATYNVRVFDKKGSMIRDFEQDIKLSPGEKRIIFIPSIITGETKISKTFINFRNTDSLTLGNAVRKDLIHTSKVINYDNGQTRLTVGVKNNSLEIKRNVEVIAILSTKDGLILDVAKTFIESFSKREEKKVYLTWQRHIEIENTRVDVYLREVNIY